MNVSSTAAASARRVEMDLEDGNKAPYKSNHLSNSC
jgi:hypothetical protein